MNSFGTKLRVTTFGESHGPAIGAVIDGFPSGIKIDFEAISEEMAARRPGSSNLVTSRKETDAPEFLSGISEDGVTLGSPIGFIIRNQDTRGNDYGDNADKFRPNHADFTYEAKYGIREYRGGGRASARETANWVAAGALAQQLLSLNGIKIQSALSGVGEVSSANQILTDLSSAPQENLILKFPEDHILKMQDEIEKAKLAGDSVGGVVTCLITGVKPGVGDPVFDKFHARLAHAMMSINAAKGFEYGLGMAAATKRGYEILDIFKYNEGIFTETNYSGGIQGGISNGMPIFFNVAFKPTPTILRELPTVDKDGKETILKMKGRHDPCVAVRAVPVVKAMAALVVADLLL